MLGKDKACNFSRKSALYMGERSLQISNSTYRLLERSRVLSIRGIGKMVQYEEVASSLEEIASIKSWMEKLLREIEVNINGRV